MVNSMQFGEFEPPVEPEIVPVFQDYPKAMIHPHARRAASTGVPGTEITDAIGRPLPGQFRAYTGTADFMPPVTVTCAAEEDYHRSLGYETGGKSSAAAFANMTATNGADPIPPVEEYPKWVGDVLVKDAAQEAAARRMLMPAVAEDAGEGPEKTWSAYEEAVQMQAAMVIHYAKLDQMQAVATKKPRTEKQLANDARLGARRKAKSDL